MHANEVQIFYVDSTKYKNFAWKDEVDSNFNCILELIISHAIFGEEKCHSKAHLTGNITIRFLAAGYDVDFLMLCSLVCGVYLSKIYMNKSLPE